MNNYQLLITNYKLSCNKLFPLVFCVILFSSCSIFRHSPSTEPPISGINKTDSITASVINNIHAHYPKFEWISAKASTSVSFNDQSLSFNTHIRIRKDSAIWVSATIPPGIEGARLLFTLDSIKLIDRLHNTYYKGTYEYLDTLFNTRLDFLTLQAIITANLNWFTIPLGNYSLIDTNQYYCWLADVPSLSNDSAIPLQCIIHFLKENYRVSGLSVDENHSNRKLLAQYKNFQESGGQFFPFQIDIQIQAEKNAAISLTFDKIEIDKPMEFPFKIPANYKPINN